MAKRGRPRYPDILTPREWEVLALLREELSNEQIAQRLDITERTARYHVSEILGKLGVASRAEAAAWQPEQRPWWMSAAAPLAFVRRKATGAPIGLSSVAMAAAVGLFVVLVVILGVGLLVWGLVRTQGGEGVASPAAPRVDSSLVVALNEVNGLITVVDPTTASVVGERNLGSQAWALLRPSASQLLVSGPGGPLRLFDLADLSQPSATIPMERLATHVYSPGMTLSRNEQFVYYARRDSVCPEGGNAAVCDEYSLSIIDLETGTEIATEGMPVGCGIGQVAPLGDVDVLFQCGYPVPRLWRATPEGEATMLATFPSSEEGLVMIGMSDGDGVYVVYSDGVVMSEGRSTPLVDLLPEEGARVGWQTDAPLGAERHFFLYGSNPDATNASAPYENLLVFDKADPSNYQTIALPFPVQHAAPIDSDHIALLNADESRLSVFELATGDIVGSSVPIASGAQWLVGG